MIRLLAAGDGTNYALLGAAATVVAAVIAALAVLIGGRGARTASLMTTFTEGLIKDRDFFKQEAADERAGRLEAEKRCKELERKLKRHEGQGR